ncbi:hypothetical protein SHIRM173S_02134 [Streptomyces hirsutus]
MTISPSVPPGAAVEAASNKLADPFPEGVQAHFGSARCPWSSAGRLRRGRAGYGRSPSPAARTARRRLERAPPPPLEGARPTAVHREVVRRALERPPGCSRPRRRSPVGGLGTALAAARQLHLEDAEASARTARHALALLDELMPGGGHPDPHPLQHRPLVSGGEGTAIAVALADAPRGRLRRLWVDETRPLLQRCSPDGIRGRP